MKKLTYLLLVFLFINASCTKEILNKQPLDIITDATVWNDPVLIDAFLTMQYSLTTVMENETPDYIASWSAGSPINNQWNILTSEHGSGPLIINEIADEAQPGWGISGNAGGYKKGGLNISGGFLEWWENAYYIIRNLNQFIERVPGSPVSADLKKQRLAEARFLRAFNYFSMVKRYGGVPLITKTQNLNDSKDVLYPKRNKEQEIYDFVISEMDAISSDLPTGLTYGRPCKWAALALKCRAALYAGSISQFGTLQLNGLLGIPQNLSSSYYQKAYDAAQVIITSGSYQLYNADPNKAMNFRNIFVKKKNCEVIFAKQHNYIDALGGGGDTWSYDFVQRPKPHAWNLGMENAAYLEMAEEFENIDGTPGTLDRNAIQQGLWSMADLWGNKDPRFFATLYTMETPWKGGMVDFHKGLIDGNGNILENQLDAYKGIAAWGNQNLYGNFHTGFGVMKYLDENLDIGSTWSNSGTDYIVFRYGEVLLNFAEAAFELGKIADALTAVNQIRARAGIASLSSVSRDNIRHERKVELAFEGHRYWDVRRWRLATNVLSKSYSGLRYILDYTTGRYKLQVLNNIDGNPSPQFYDRNYYFPITLNRTGANTNLVENPGY
jgi:hypothetical protein